MKKRDVEKDVERREEMLEDVGRCVSSFVISDVSLWEETWTERERKRGENGRKDVFERSET